MTASPRTTTTDATDSTRTAPTRSPLAVRVAAGLLVPIVAVSAVGLVMFGFVWGDAGGPGLVFTVLALAALLTAAAALPSLLRGDRAGWLITTGWSVAYAYWSVYKVFVEEEFESTPLLVGAVAVCALLLSRPARRHADLT